MPRSGPDTGPSARQEPDADPDPQEDVVIELVGDVPFIYPDTPASEDQMSKLRGDVA